MKYVLLDNFNGTLYIVSKDDGSGEPLVFTSLVEATEALDENCQDGVVIPLNTNFMDLLSKCEQFISTIFDEEGEDNFEPEGSILVKELQEVLDMK